MAGRNWPLPGYEVNQAPAPSRRQAPTLAPAKKAGTELIGSDGRPLVAEVRPALLRLEVGLDVVERVHGATHALPDQLVELDRLRQREIAPHLHRDLVMLQRSKMPGGDLARDGDRMLFEPIGGHPPACAAPRRGFAPPDISADQRRMRARLHRQGPAPPR